MNKPLFPYLIGLIALFTLVFWLRQTGSGVSPKDWTPELKELADRENLSVSLSSNALGQTELDGLRLCFAAARHKDRALGDGDVTTTFQVDLHSRRIVNFEIQEASSSLTSAPLLKCIRKRARRWKALPLDAYSHDPSREQILSFRSRRPEEASPPPSVASPVSQPVPLPLTAPNPKPNPKPRSRPSDAGQYKQLDEIAHRDGLSVTLIDDTGAAASPEALFPWIELDLDGLRRCYAWARQLDPSVGEGNVALISKRLPNSTKLSGIDVLDEGTTLQSPLLDLCLQGRVASWALTAEDDFPAAKPKRQVEHQRYTFQFRQTAEPPSADALQHVDQEAGGSDSAPPALAREPARAGSPMRRGGNMSWEEEVARSVLRRNAWEASAPERWREIDYCYERERLVFPELDRDVKNVIVQSTRSPSGAITHTLLDEGLPERFANCVRDRIAKWQTSDTGWRFGLSERRFSDQPRQAVDEQEPFEMAFERKVEAFSRAQVQEVIDANLGQFHACSWRIPSHLIHGKRLPLELWLALDRNGIVRQVNAAFPTLPAAEQLSALSTCLGTAARTWRFPLPQDRLATSIHLRLTFKASDVEPASFNPITSDFGIFSNAILGRARDELHADLLEIASVPNGAAFREVVAAKAARLLKRCPGAGIAFREGEAIPLQFELAPDGRVLKETLTLGFRAPSKAHPAKPRKGGAAWRHFQTESWRAAKATDALNFMTCLQREVGAWKFPKVPGGGRASVSHRLVWREPIRAKQATRQGGDGCRGPNGEWRCKKTVTLEDHGATIDGSLGWPSIRKILAQNMGEIRHCYEEALQNQPYLAGKLPVRFDIAPEGNVMKVEFGPISSTIQSETLVECFQARIGSWHFPESPTGARVSVSYRMVRERR